MLLDSFNGLVSAKAAAEDPYCGDSLDLLAGVEVVLVSILKTKTLIALSNPLGSGYEQVGRAALRLPWDVALHLLFNLVRVVVILLKISATLRRTCRHLSKSAVYTRRRCGGR